MGFGPRIGERSTHQVLCIVCDQTFGNAASHDCPYQGAGLRKQLDAIRARLAWLESFHDGVPATSEDPKT